MFEMPHRPHPVGCCRVDRLDAARADGEVDELRDGEVLRGGAEGAENLEIPGVRVIPANDLRVGQGEVGRPRGGDLGAAVEGEGNRAQYGQQVDRCRTVEKETRRREDVRDAAPFEDVEVVVELRRPPEKERVLPQIAAACRDPRRDQGASMTVMVISAAGESVLAARSR